MMTSFSSPSRDEKMEKDAADYRDDPPPVKALGGFFSDFFIFRPPPGRPLSLVLRNYFNY